MTILGDITFLGYLTTAALAFVLGFGRMLRQQVSNQFAVAGFSADGEFDEDADIITPGFQRLVLSSYALAILFFAYLLVAGLNGWGTPPSMAFLGSFFSA